VCISVFPGSATSELRWGGKWSTYIEARLFCIDYLKNYEYRFQFLHVSEDGVFSRHGPFLSKIQYNFITVLWPLQIWNKFVYRVYMFTELGTHTLVAYTTWRWIGAGKKLPRSLQVLTSICIRHICPAALSVSSSPLNTLSNVISSVAVQHRVTWPAVQFT